MTKESTIERRTMLMTERTTTNRLGFEQRATAQWLRDEHVRFAHLAKLLDGEVKRIAEVMALEIARKVNEFVLEPDRL
jgi:hypothetical protein